MRDASLTAERHTAVSSECRTQESGVGIFWFSVLPVLLKYLDQKKRAVNIYYTKMFGIVLGLLMCPKGLHLVSGERSNDYHVS